MGFRPAPEPAPRPLEFWIPVRKCRAVGTDSLAGVGYRHPRSDERGADDLTRGSVRHDCLFRSGGCARRCSLDFLTLCFDHLPYVFIVGASLP